MELASAFTLDDARAAGLRDDQVYELLERSETSGLVAARSCARL